MNEAAASDPSGPISLVLSCFVLLAAGFLGWRQVVDRRRRAGDLGPADRRHFAMRDARRWTGTLALVVLAASIAIGGSMPARIAEKPNLRFIQLWAGVVFLIVALLVLAMADWFATRLYATRLRARLAREGLSIVEAELRIRVAIQRGMPPYDRNGSGPHGGNVT